MVPRGRLDQHVKEKPRKGHVYAGLFLQKTHTYAKLAKRGKLRKTVELKRGVRGTKKEKKKRREMEKVKEMGRWVGMGGRQGELL